MENREFIAANDLPEIEAETVDVLCVDPETGEMGKKSGAALGGGGGYILMPTMDEISDEDVWLNITSDCTDMVKAIEAGASVSVLLPGGVSGISHNMLFSIIGFRVNEDNKLDGLSAAFEFVFTNAPIPIILQGDAR